MKGGEKWEQGSDGCIFKPSVACKNDNTANPPNTVSKLILKDSIDEKVENFIAVHFPHVVKGKGVLIAEKRCEPEFKDTNLVVSAQNPSLKKNGEPCAKITSTTDTSLYTNFIYEEYDKSLFDAVYFESIDDTLKVLCRALNAAVALVPDDGPWIIGLDFHTGNILVKTENPPDKTDKKPYSSLADWGRTLIIENPHDFSSIQKGIKETFEALKKMKEVSDTFLSYAQGEKANYNQFGIVVRRALNSLLSAKETDPTNKINKNIVRANSIYGILRSCNQYTPLKEFKKTFTKNDGTQETKTLQDLSDEILNTTSQQDIVSTINKYFGANYIDLNAFFPKTTRGGKRKTKKALKKSKKRKTRR